MIIKSFIYLFRSISLEIFLFIYKYCGAAVSYLGIEDTAGSGELLFGPSLGRANTASHLFLDLLSGPTPSWSAYVYVSFAGSLQLRQLCLTPFAAVQGYIWYALHAFPKFLYLLLFFPVLEYFFTKAVPEFSICNCFLTVLILRRYGAQIKTLG